MDCTLKAFGCEGGYPRCEEDKHNKLFKYKHIEMIAKNCVIIKEMNSKIESQANEIIALNEKFEKVMDGLNNRNKENLQRDFEM